MPVGGPRNGGRRAFPNCRPSSLGCPNDPPPEKDRVYLFDIAVSRDGRNWETVYKDGKGAAEGHDVFHTYEFPEVEARYVRVIAKGSNVGKNGREGSTIFHLSRVLMLPEPRFEPTKPVPQIRPASLFRQQLADRAGR